METDVPRTRARSGADPALSHPIHPSRLLFGSVDAAAVLDSPSPSAVHPARPSALRATRPATASAVGSGTSVSRPSATSVARPVNAVRVAEPLSEKHSVRGIGSGWTPVPCQPSRSHPSESRIEHTVNEFDSTNSHHASMSRSELKELARQHEAYAVYLRAQLQHTAVPDSAQESESDSSEIKEPVSVPYTTPEEEFSSTQEAEELVVRAQPSRRAATKETKNVGDFTLHIPTVELVRGLSRKKVKGAVDSTNWGDVSFLEDFAESKMNSQKVALDNSAGISRAEEHKRVTTPCEVLVDVSVPHRPKPDAGNAESQAQALELHGQLRQFNCDASKLKPSAPKAELQEVQAELQPRSNASRPDIESLALRRGEDCAPV
ncbi:hypothetical protein C8R46DRAFT_1191525 [Mycena filopes]|nr:hypothetical protein C8R46DRAFT_1191525 [Mycena filopes]